MNGAVQATSAEVSERKVPMAVAAIQQVAVTAVFTFTCYTVPVVRVDGATARAVEQETTPAEVPVGLPAWGGAGTAEQVKVLKAKLRQEQEAILVKYQALLKSGGDISREEREKVRLAMKAEQEALLARQKELRDEMKVQLQQFKREHPDHAEWIEAGRETARGRAGQRRGTSEG